MIDFTARRGRAADEPSSPAEASAAGTMLDLPFLVERLEAPATPVRMWAAFQLVDRWEHECDRFVESMWNSPLPEIRESAVNLIGRHRLEHYAFPLLRLLKSDEAGLRLAAGLALGRLRYEPAEKPLVSWFETLFAHRDPGAHELECAAEALLHFDRRRFWELLHERLGACRQSHTVFSTLFRLLCRFAETPSEFQRLAEAHAEPREAFHDAHLAQELVEMAGRANVSRYLQSRLSGGYPLPAIYQECIRLLGYEPPDANVQQLIAAMEPCNATSGGVGTFLVIGASLIERLAPNSPHAARGRAFLQGALAWLPRWEEAILKVREVEYHLLISVPLVVLLHHAERECLADPEGQALRISRIYQSPLLSSEFMREVLTLLSRKPQAADSATLGSTMLHGWLWDEEKDTLWKLFTGQLDGVDYPFEQTIPQPWSYRIPTLMPRLVGALSDRLPFYLQSGREQAVDYVLEVFRHEGGEVLIEQALTHFDTLFNHHFRQFVDFMTHLPHRSFLEPLLARYREDEYELERLIRFICDVHGLSYPPALAQREPSKGAGAATVRLLCAGCESAYQYAVRQLYVNEECVEQRQVPRVEDLWTPDRLRCKNCRELLPFAPDHHYLQDLYAELLAARIVPPAQRAATGLDRIQTVAFPVWGGRTVNPHDFLAREAELAPPEATGEEAVAYLDELGRFFVEIGDWPRAKAVFERILAGPVPFPKALYYLGVIAFQQHNMYEARVHFSRLIASATRDDFERELDNPIDMAHHYLKLLDKREYKRSQFHLVSS